MEQHQVVLAVALEVTDRTDFPAGPVGGAETLRHAVDAHGVEVLTIETGHQDRVLAVAVEVATADQRPVVAAETVAERDPAVGAVGPGSDRVQFRRVPDDGVRALVSGQVADFVLPCDIVCVREVTDVLPRGAVRVVDRIGVEADVRALDLVHDHVADEHGIRLAVAGHVVAAEVLPFGGMAAAGGLPVGRTVHPVAVLIVVAGPDEHHVGHAVGVDVALRNKLLARGGLVHDKGVARRRFGREPDVVDRLHAPLPGGEVHIFQHERRFRGRGREFLIVVRILHDVFLHAGSVVRARRPAQRDRLIRHERLEPGGSRGRGGVDGVERGRSVDRVVEIEEYLSGVFDLRAARQAGHGLDRVVEVAFAASGIIVDKQHALRQVLKLEAGFRVDGGEGGDELARFLVEVDRDRDGDLRIAEIQDDLSVEGVAPFRQLVGVPRQREAVQTEGVEVQIGVHHVPDQHFPRGGGGIFRVVFEEDGVLQAVAVQDAMQIGDALRRQLVVGVVAGSGLRVRAGGAGAAFRLGFAGLVLVLQLMPAAPCHLDGLFLGTPRRGILKTREEMGNIGIVQFRGEFGRPDRAVLRGYGALLVQALRHVDAALVIVGDSLAGFRDPLAARGFHRIEPFIGRVAGADLRRARFQVGRQVGVVQLVIEVIEYLDFFGMGQVVEEAALFVLGGQAGRIALHAVQVEVVDRVVVGVGVEVCAVAEQ